MLTESSAARLARLRASIGTGKIPLDLLPWIVDLAAEATATDVEAPAMSPAERLAIQVSATIDSWMLRRRITHRTISVCRRSLSRALKARNVNLSTVADIADALNCDALIEFRPRGVSGAKVDISVSTTCDGSASPSL